MCDLTQPVLLRDRKVPLLRLIVRELSTDMRDGTLTCNIRQRDRLG